MGIIVAFVIGVGVGAAVVTIWALTAPGREEKQEPQWHQTGAAGGYWE